MSAVRPAAVAGSFYPADFARLSSMVDGFLEGAPTRSPLPPNALVVPHAGYIYSGPIAASAYALLANLPERPARIALFGPSHYVGFSGLALPEADALSTPLGIAALDEIGLAHVQRFSQVVRSDTVHRREHSLEVQLPFLQKLLPDVPVLPFAVGRARAIEVAQVMEALATIPGTLIIVSTDLSHFLSWKEAHELDAQTANAVLKLQPDAIEPDQACGSIALSGLLRVANDHGLRPELLDLRNSGDTAGDKERVVGYGAFGFFGGAQ